MDSDARFLVSIFLMIAIPALVGLYVKMKKITFVGTRAFKFLSAYLIFMILLYHVWVEEAYMDREMWIVTLILILLALFGAYCLARLTEVIHKENEERKKK